MARLQWRKRRAAALPPAAVSPLPVLPDERLGQPEVAENVDYLLATTRDALAAEESRDQSFNSRGVGLAGFVGIIVSLSTTLGRDALQANMPGVWRGVSIGLFGLALAFLIATVVIVIRVVLQPKESAHLAFSEIEEYARPDALYQHKVMSQGKVLRGYIGILAVERSRGTSKARGLRWGYRTLIAGLACIASLGFILGLHDAEVIPDGGAKRIEYRICATPVASGHARDGARPRFRFSLQQACD